MLTSVSHSTSRKPARIGVPPDSSTRKSSITNRFRFVARPLLFAVAMFCAPTSCVLPPPPRTQPETVQELQIDFNLVKPLNVSAIHLDRLFDAPKQRFEVTGAIDDDVNLYWFVDFDVAGAGEELTFASVGTFHDVAPCDTLLLEGDPRVVLVEVFVTRGVLVKDPTGESADPRVTLDGEPLQKITWTVVLNGPVNGCVPDSE